MYKLIIQHATESLATTTKVLNGKLTLINNERVIIVSITFMKKVILVYLSWFPYNLNIVILLFLLFNIIEQNCLNCSFNGTYGTTHERDPFTRSIFATSHLFGATTKTFISKLPLSKASVITYDTISLFCVPWKWHSRNHVAQLTTVNCIHLNITITSH